MPTDTEMDAMPPFAQDHFEKFIDSLEAASNEEGDTPITIDLVGEEGDIAINWNQDDPKMEFMSLYSERAITLFVSELIRRASESVDDYSVEVTPEENV
jgi:hypothetical protein